MFPPFPQGLGYFWHLSGRSLEWKWWNGSGGNGTRCMWQGIMYNYYLYFFNPHPACKCLFWKHTCVCVAVHIFVLRYCIPGSGWEEKNRYLTLLVRVCVSAVDVGRSFFQWCRFFSSLLCYILCIWSTHNHAYCDMQGYALYRVSCSKINIIYSFRVTFFVVLHTSTVDEQTGSSLSWYLK